MTTRARSYPTEVFWSEEDEGFIAIVPDLPGCSAYGETRQEALDSLDDGIEAWIEAAEAAGNPVPSPSTRSGAVSRYSGRLLVRMPRTLHATLAKEADQEGVSLNQYVVFLLTQGHAHHSVQNLTSAVARQFIAVVSSTETRRISPGFSVISGLASEPMLLSAPHSEAQLKAYTSVSSLTEQRYA